MAHDWRHGFKTGPKCDAYLDKSIGLMTKFQSMSDVYLGSINVVKHCTEVAWDETGPIHSAPYREGPNAREFETSEIEKMMIVGVIDSAKTE